MGTSGSGRLVWKLWRETRGALLVLAAVPMAGLTAAALLPRSSPAAQFVAFILEYVSAYMAPAIAGVIGATRGQQDWDDTHYGPSHLPVNAGDVVAASFALPLVAAAALGLWAGFWSLVWASLMPHTIDPLHNSDAVRLCLLWAVLTSGCFALGYAASAVSNARAGIIAPAVAANIGPVVLLDAARSIAAGSDGLPDSPAAWAFVAAIVLAPMAASIVWAASRRKLMIWRRWAALGAGALVLAACASPALLVAWTKASPGAGFAAVDSEDGSLVVSMTGQFGGRAGSGTYCQFQDRRSGATARALFPLFVQPLGFAPGQRAVVATRKPGESRMAIRVWSLRDNSIREVAAIPYNPRAAFSLGTDLTYRGGFVAWVRPDGRWMLMRTRPSNGSGVDLWLVDLQHGGAKIVYPNYTAFGDNTIIWTKDRAIVSGSPPPIVVDLAAGTARCTRYRWEAKR